MKKWIALIIVLVILLSGCTNATDETLASTTDPSTASTADTVTTILPDYTIPPRPMVTVGVPATTVKTSSSDGTPLSYYTYQTMSLVVPEPEVADKIIIDFLGRIDQTAETGESIANQANTNYDGSKTWTPYICNLLYSPMRIDQSVLSLYGNLIIYSGSAHPEHSCRSANYDMVTGDVLTLGSILENEDAKANLCRLVLEVLSHKAEKLYLREGYEETVRQRFAREESYDEDWYFSQNGLCFYFAPYEIAPYASGVITAEIPYSKLFGILSDAFFPPETDITSGVISTLPVQGTDLSQFSRISELILDEDLPALLLQTNDTIHNLRITSWDAATNTEFTVFAAQTLAAVDAVIIEASQDTLEKLTVSYESSGDTLTQPLI